MIDSHLRISGKARGIGEDGERSLERLEIARTEDHRSRAPVASEHDPVVVAFHPVDNLGQPRVARFEVLGQAVGGWASVTMGAGLGGSVRFWRYR